MCGIFCYVGKNYSEKDLLENFNRIKLRGPDSSRIITKDNVLLGFHRLSINDISENGMQPFISDGLYLICNGEIYNHKELYKLFLSSSCELKSNSDCEVIIHLYKLFGIERTCQLLDGVFSFVLYDSLKETVFVARDPYGIRPLFIGQTDNKEYFFSSEMKAIHDKCSNIRQFDSGSYLEYSSSKFSIQKFHELKKRNLYGKDFQEEIFSCIRKLLIKSVEKRLLSDRPIGALLSGGLDSSLICGIISKLYKEKGIKNKLKTFSIGIKGSTDLVYAQNVADYINSEHHNIECTEEEFLNAIPEVIYNIESYDTTTVRASVGNYLVGKYIKENTDIVVLFNGDGSDEQSGYYYLRNAPTKDEFHKECLKLLDEIKYYDVLRSDRSVSSKWSLEARTPFLDKEFVEFYMTIDPRKKMYNDTIIEKNLLRKAFSNKNIIPDEVLWRPKEAFSDGCSSEKRSWHKIIQEHVDLIIPDVEFNDIKNTNKYKINPPMLKESYWYRKIFDSLYPNHAEIIPHYWLPNWTEEVDPSARELK